MKFPQWPISQKSILDKTANRIDKSLFGEEYNPTPEKAVIVAICSNIFGLHRVYAGRKISAIVGWFFLALSLIAREYVGILLCWLVIDVIRILLCNYGRIKSKPCFNLSKLKELFTCKTGIISRLVLIIVSVTTTVLLLMFAPKTPPLSINNAAATPDVAIEQSSDTEAFEDTSSVAVTFDEAHKDTTTSLSDMVESKNESADTSNLTSSLIKEQSSETHSSETHSVKSLTSSMTSSQSTSQSSSEETHSDKSDDVSNSSVTSHQNYLMSLPIYEAPMMNGFETERIGTVGYIVTSKDILKNCSEQDYIEFITSRVEGSDYNGFTIDFGDGTGIVFPGCYIYSAYYGEIDEHDRCIISAEGYIVYLNGKVEDEPIDELD